MLRSARGLTCYDPMPRSLALQLAGPARAAAPHAGLGAADRRLRNRRHATSSPPRSRAHAARMSSWRGGHRLTIRGIAGSPRRRRAPRHYHQVERGHGAFARTFEFADADRRRRDLGRPARRRAHGDAARRPPTAARRIEVSVRHDQTVAILSLSSCCRLRRRPRRSPAGCTRQRPASAPRPTAPQPDAARGRRPAPAAPRSAGCPISRASPQRAIRQRHEHLVDCRSSAAELAVRQRSVLPVLLRRRRCSDREPRRAEPRLGRHRLGRRLRPHQQPRRRRRGAPRSSVALADKREMRGARSSASTTGPTSALLKVDARGPADAAVGRLVEAQGRRVGAGDRQPVPAEPDGHARHRQRARPQPNVGIADLRGLHPDRRGDQSRQLGRRARSTRAASSSASTPRSLAERRLPGHRLRGAEQPGAPRHGRPDQVRRGPARDDYRHRAPAADRRSIAGSSARRTRAARWCAASARDRKPINRACVSSTSLRASTIRISTTRISSCECWRTRRLDHL